MRHATSASAGDVAGPGVIITAAAAGNIAAAGATAAAESENNVTVSCEALRRSAGACAMAALSCTTSACSSLPGRAPISFKGMTLAAVWGMAV